MATHYLEMSNPQYDIINKRIRYSYPNSCICWIEEITNDRIQGAYATYKFNIAKKGAINEVQLFHGTSEDAVNSIVASGFNPDYNKASAYGKGTYFAKNASYSFAYMKPNKQGISFMFLCDVILGTSCIGSPNLIIDTTKFDSSVDNLESPTIVVTPHADGAVPRYIIAFHKTAK